MARDCITELESHQINKMLEEILGEVKKLHGAFPVKEDGESDIEGHRKYHEAMIEAAKAQTEFWRELKLDIAKKGIWGLLIVLVGLVMAGLAAKIGIAEVNLIKS